MDGAGAAKRLQSKVISEGAAHKSPERSRRKGKWVTERKELPVEEDGASRRRLQDPVALEDNAADEGNGRRPFKRGRYEQQHQNPRVVAERNENPEYVPRSGHFYEHDDRSSWRPRSTPRRRPFEGGRIEERGTVRKADERWDGGVQEEAGARGGDRWHHDRFEQERPEAKKGRPPARFNGGRSRDGGRGTGRRVGIQRMNGRGNTQADRGRWGDEEPPRGGRNEPARVARSRGPPPSTNENDTRGIRQPARVEA